MLISQKSNLKPLIQSKDGVHLTAYLLNQGDLVDLKVQLRTTLDESYECLAEVMSNDELKKFLSPIESLLDDARIFHQMKGNIGIFRNKDLFRVLHVPVDIEPSCQIATSFHVKPLLRWMQGDQDFLFLGLDKKSAHLFWGNQNSIKSLDSFLFSEALRKKGSHSALFKSLNQWLMDWTKKNKPKLYLAGEPSLVGNLKKHLSYTNLYKKLVADSFNDQNSSSAFQTIRMIISDECTKNLDEKLMEFRFADEEGRVTKNIFQISEAVVQGRVKKLIVTDDINVFGKINKKSGALSIHPFDLDHEDDCILDDLAQMVLSQGGDVVIAKQSEIPKGRPILAILDDDEKSLEKPINIEKQKLNEVNIL